MTKLLVLNQIILKLFMYSYSKCITNGNKSIVICCFDNTEISNSLGKGKMV